MSKHYFLLGLIAAFMGVAVGLSIGFDISKQNYEPMFQTCMDTMKQATEVLKQKNAQIAELTSQRDELEQACIVDRTPANQTGDGIVYSYGNDGKPAKLKCSNVWDGTQMENVCKVEQR